MVVILYQISFYDNNCLFRVSLCEVYLWQENVICTTNMKPFYKFIPYT